MGSQCIYIIIHFSFSILLIFSLHHALESVIYSPENTIETYKRYVIGWIFVIPTWVQCWNDSPPDHSMIELV